MCDHTTPVNTKKKEYIGVNKHIFSIRLVVDGVCSQC